MSTKDPFASALVHARIDADLQQGQVARLLSRSRDKKVSQSTVSRWESGKQIPTDDQFEDLIALVIERAPQHADALRRTRSPELPGLVLYSVLFGEAPGRRRKPVPVMLPEHWLDGGTPTYTREGERIGALGSRTDMRPRVVVESDLWLATALERMLAPHMSASVRGWSVGDPLPEDEPRVLTIGWLSNPWYQARRNLSTFSAESELKRWGVKASRKEKSNLMLFERRRVPRPASASGTVVTLLGGIGASHTRRSADLFAPQNILEVAGRLREHAAGLDEVSMVVEVPLDRGGDLLVSELQVHSHKKP